MQASKRHPVQQTQRRRRTPRRSGPKMGTDVPRMGTPTPRRKRTSIADALLSRTQQRVLGLLFSHPERSFFGREIITRSGSGSGAVQRELARLAESGLVVVRKVGNQVHYQVNLDAPIYPELRSLIEKTVGLAEPLRKALNPLRDRIELAFIYGSVANGEDRAASDVDLLLVSDDLPFDELFARLIPVEKALGRTINPTLYTSAEFHELRESGSPFLAHVFSRKTIPLISSDDADRSTGESRS
jgi:predicted nucleotidyltransferase